MISDAQARALASYWRDQHDADAPLSVLARTGAISIETASALERDLRALARATAGHEQGVFNAQAQLGALLVYVRGRGPRGPVPGWREVPHRESRTQASQTQLSV